MTRVVCGGWVYFTMGVCILLSGCSLTPLQKDFSCAYKDGEPCLSITEADKKAVLGTRDSSFEKEETNFFTSHESRTTSHALQAPQRIPDRVARVWMAPFEDTDGNWHAASYVYTVSDSAHWKPRGVNSGFGTRGSDFEKEKTISSLHESRTTKHESRGAP